MSGEDESKVGGRRLFLDSVGLRTYQRLFLGLIGFQTLMMSENDCEAAAIGFL